MGLYPNVYRVSGGGGIKLRTSTGYGVQLRLLAGCAVICVGGEAIKVVASVEIIVPLPPVSKPTLLAVPNT